MGTLWPVFGFQQWLLIMYCVGVQVPYPLVNLLTRPPQTLHGQTPLTFRTKTFDSFTLYFVKESEASDVFESVRELTVVGTWPVLHRLDGL